MESNINFDVLQSKTNYYKKYYMANREKLLARSKQRYHSKKDDLLSKSNHKSCSPEQATLSPLGLGSEAETKEKSEEVFHIEDVEVPNDAQRANHKSCSPEQATLSPLGLGNEVKTTIEKIKELFNVVKTE